MGKIESLKIILELIKTLIAIMITAFFGIAGYLAINHNTLDFVVIIGAGVGSIALSVGLYVCAIIFRKKCKELEVLK